MVKRKHTWIMACLYIGTFGSFIGYSAAFPLLIKTQFPAITIAIAFLGPLVGSLSRPLGGWLADKIGGARHHVLEFHRDGRAPRSASSTSSGTRISPASCRCSWSCS